MDISRIREFYKGKRVLVTGHTGFKGSWMVSVLKECGAIITGYALMPPTEPSMFKMLGYDSDKEDLNAARRGITETAETADLSGTKYETAETSDLQCTGDNSAAKNNDNSATKNNDNREGHLTNIFADIRDLDALGAAFKKAQPEIVIHMAAQPIVRESYRDPVGTYASNVMGTVNVLECVRLTESVKSFVNVTTDKVYKNGEREEGYKEDEELNGYDPYSNSKSCSELVTDSYRKSFFIDESTGKSILPSGRTVAITTMRAGNVIGGGDFAKDRIIPDCIRAAMAGEDIIVRNPYSTRPYQHVLEPVCMYLYMAMMQYENPSFAGAYNIGPRDEDAWTTGEIATLFCDTWNGNANCIGNSTGNSIGNDIVNGNFGAEETSDRPNRKTARWINKSDGGPHEATYLKLDIGKIKEVFGWQPRWSVTEAMDKIVEWTLRCSTDSRDRTECEADGKAENKTNDKTEYKMEWTDSVEAVRCVTRKQIEEYLGG